jgi:CHASE3 domain sensor protein
MTPQSILEIAGLPVTKDNIIRLTESAESTRDKISANNDATLFNKVIEPYRRQFEELLKTIYDEGNKSMLISNFNEYVNKIKSAANSYDNSKVASAKEDLNQFVNHVKFQNYP